MTTTGRCPVCKTRTAFHVDIVNGRYFLKCWAPNQCDFYKEIVFVDNETKFRR